MQYQWLILQDGNLPLRPHGRMMLAEHVCTTTVIWPLNGELCTQSSVVIDPCFSEPGLQQAEARLEQLRVGLDDIGYFFVSHEHGDHMLRVPAKHRTWKFPWHSRFVQTPWQIFSPEVHADFQDIRVINCPGHAPDLKALCFRDARHEVWIVADAILNREWLLAWDYYWPNFYEPEEIIETWRSVASILRTADVVIPGHGLPIIVDKPLLSELVSNFRMGEQTHLCPDVEATLQQRLSQLS